MTAKRFSHRPKVSDVHYWLPVVDKFVGPSWREVDGTDRHVLVERGYPFDNFYRVAIRDVGGTNKKSKLFYGETAWFDAVRWAADNNVDVHDEMQ